jgi:integrase
VAYQVKCVRGRLVFAPPKGARERDVPLPSRVAEQIRAHVEQSPPVEVTLPWLVPEGRAVTKTLLFTGVRGNAIRQTVFNTDAWKPALVTAELIPKPSKGNSYQVAREHGMHALRHHYASVLLDAGENIKVLSAYLGHADPGFTLRTYTHLMPSSDGRARKAVDHLYSTMDSNSDGPQTAQA